MRILPILMAIVVAFILYFAIIDRETARVFLGISDAVEAVETVQTPTSDTPLKKALIKVVAQHSSAQQIDSAVVLRGQTEAARQVEVRAETSSTVISPPLPKGTFVEKGQLMCQLDSGTRGASLAEAKAR